MITVSPTQSTLVTATLQENAIYQASGEYYYTWSISNKGTNEVIFFCNSEVSPNPNYYNQIYVVPGVGSLTQGVIDIYPGEWTYNVFQTLEQNDLELTSLLTTIETGIMIIPSVITQSSIPGFGASLVQTIPGSNLTN